MHTKRILSLTLALAAISFAPALVGCTAETQAETDEGESADAASDEAESSDENTGEALEKLTSVTLQPWDTITAPTWTFWGWTTVEITNSSQSQSGTVSLQAGAAAPEYVWVGKAGQLCAWYNPSFCFPNPTTVTVQRQWAGMPVHITNVSSVPLQVKVY